MTPRRSSRAHTTQPTPSVPSHNNSSTSSVSSGRTDRNSRSHHKLPSPRSSIAPRSQSSEEIDGSTKPQPRRTRSSQDNVISEATNIAVDDEEEEESEEEITRCICGQAEYPGIPVEASDSAKPSAKSNGDTISSIALPEDAGGLFIQCDICKVWQHGGCVGIMDEAMSPEEYFCEECRSDLHKITSTASGQKFSRYLPVQEDTSPPSSPPPATQESSSRKSKESRASRLNAEIVAGKRRSTMNSRDSAYDEAEQLRRAIEESKKEAGATSTETGGRKGKRSRSESEQRLEDAKRQRTGSGSSSSPPDSKSFPPDANSEDEGDTGTKSGEGGNKKIRGAAARNHRNKELREREEQRERERADAAGRRKGRAERRRGDDSDPSEEPPSYNTSSKGAEPSSVPTTTSIPPPQDPPAPRPSHKKTGRPPARRGRVGRNQYTRDRDPRLDGSVNADNNTSPARSRSGDGDDTPHTNGNHHHSSHHNEHGKASKPRYMNPNRTSMNDMKRRVAGILEFISRTQVEMAGTDMASRNMTTSPPDHGGGNKELGKLLLSELDDGLDGFGKLSSVEMMEVLTRRLMRWQGEYGKLGEK